jgi:hypothetical protein
MRRLEGLALVAAVSLALSACSRGSLGSPDPFPPSPRVGASAVIWYSR